eukprot:363066-Chlamydomonas_euryale.AAC.12
MRWSPSRCWASWSHPLSPAQRRPQLRVCKHVGVLRAIEHQGAVSAAATATAPRRGCRGPTHTKW